GGPRRIPAFKLIPRCQWAGRLALPACRESGASSPLAGWSAALATRVQCFFTFPSGPIQTVERITPVVFLPYIIFSPHAPYFVITFLSGSESSRNDSLYFFVKRACDVAPSGEMPSTTASCFSIARYRSRNPHASLVQPGVSSLG